ncbi:hypothetical protein C8E02_0552 [Vogesella indigofera]|uniref:Uncharacterized protein n=1 Tax=Vogesella indigofera TaxID=45465 RepID=A0A495BHG2_VOGIN|nr:hypothetical protein [Vogesella indigofera]RKQ60799.1 hypothetical protein C8E02_0552 [Vogesella indigofera]
MIGKFIIALAAVYHVIATVAAMMAIFHFARTLRGEENGHPFWRHVFNWGETHLWISGAILIGAGIYLSSFAEYLNNPKLWTKVSLVVLWAVTSYAIRRSSRGASMARRNLLFGISSGSLLYGTFLGVAKPLAYGVLPFPWFLAGFVATIALCTIGVVRMLPPVTQIQKHTHDPV